MINAGVKLEKILCYSTKIEGQETFENKGIAKIQDEMIKCEKRIVSHLVGKNLLNQDCYLIKDGSIQYKPMKTGDFKELAHIRNNYRHAIGVSKKFNPNLMKDNKGQSSAGQIARLPLYHRTPAFLWQPGEQWGNLNFAIWYVRIRDISKTESPYAGILKQYCVSGFALRLFLACSASSLWFAISSSLKVLGLKAVMWFMLGL